MIITPWKELAGHSDYQPTTANFPCLKHLFPCDATDVAAQMLRDSIGGIFCSGGTLAAHTTKSQCITTDTQLTLASGTVATPGTKSILLCTVAYPAATTASMTLGSVAAAGNQGIRINASGATSRTAGALNGTTTALCTDGPTGANAMLAYAAQLAIVASSTSTLHSVSYDGTTFTGYTDKTIANTPAGGMTAIEQACIINPGINPGVIFVLHPTTAFTNAEMQAIVAWAYWAIFTANSGAGNKNAVIAPWLRSRA